MTNEAINKALFQHPEVVRDMLMHYVSDELFSEIDCTTLEPLPKEFAAEGIRNRNSDCIRKTSFRGKDAYIIVLHASEITAEIPVRMFAYSTVLWNDLVDAALVDKTSGLPPVFPIILYSGNDAPDGDSLNIADFSSPVFSVLAAFLPRQHSLLIKECDFSDEELHKKHGFYAFVLQLKRCTTSQELSTLIHTYKDLLTKPDHQEFLKTLLIVVRDLLMRFPSFAQEIPEFATLDELESLLQKTATN